MRISIPDPTRDKLASRGPARVRHLPTRLLVIADPHFGPRVEQKIGGRDSSTTVRGREADSVIYGTVGGRDNYWRKVRQIMLLACLADQPQNGLVA
jgi:hypothetical protein